MLHDYHKGANLHSTKGVKRFFFFFFGWCRDGSVLSILSHDANSRSGALMFSTHLDAADDHVMRGDPEEQDKNTLIPKGTRG